MLKMIKNLNKIQRNFELDKDNKFKRLKFEYNNETVNLKGKSMDELGIMEIIKLKKYSAKYLDETFVELEKQKLLESLM